MPRRRPAAAPTDPRELAFESALASVGGQPFLAPLCRVVSVQRVDDALLRHRQGWARVTGDSVVIADAGRAGDVDEWIWVLSHCLLHLGFGHLDADRDGPFDAAQHAAACLAVTRFQRDLRIGRAPMFVPDDLPGTEESLLALHWRQGGVPAAYTGLGAGGYGPDFARPTGPAPEPTGIVAPTFAELFAVGLSSAATAAVDAVGEARRATEPSRAGPWERAREWFVSSYPLLGALASGFRIVADAEVARSADIAVAAVDPALGEIYVNPLITMEPPERRFVIAHEMLHAALRHGERVAHRDPYLWNVAADLVINGWLVEMGVGEAPAGLLYDPQLKGLSTEAVYDRIAGDLRRFRRLGTLRGRGLGDVLAHPLPGSAEATRATDLDAFYRRALSTGLAYHETAGRGLLPAGLVAEIRVLDEPPPPWDVQLARWFDEHFPAVERHRSYARASRRQGATPHIPRPGWVRPDDPQRRSTFGVVLDTSGSMSARLLGRALGAIASFATAHDVPAARVVFCDALAYDAGYLRVDEIAGRVRVRGRGGTALQPGVDLLHRVADFPPDGPILLITDGYCDAVRIRRSHAFLVPAGARLPFNPRGPVFRMR